MGRTANPWRAAETWSPCLASHGVSFMPRRGYPPTQTWRTFLRNQAFAIGTTGLGEAGRLSDALLALVRVWIARVVGCVTKVRDGISCRLIEPSHRLPSYRSSYRTDRRAVHGRCVPIPPWPTTLGAGNWSMAARRISPYRSRASPRRKLPPFTNFARPWLSPTRAKPSGCTARLPRTTRSKTMILNASAPPADASASRPWRTRLQGTTG
jgi:hypothetical protein